LPKSGPKLRPLEPKDREPIHALLHANKPVFSEEEVRTAMECFEQGIVPVPNDPDPYHFLVAEESGRVVGFTCYGTTPLTQGTWDLYWIAVHPERHGARVGRVLMEKVEADVASRGGRLIVVETSGRDEYTKTRLFYEKLKYERIAVIKDFYKQGDDKVLYAKYLAPTEPPPAPHA
jgi:ribosomal protein S18 acetylase RimI-like enzyme